MSRSRKESAASRLKPHASIRDGCVLHAALFDAGSLARRWLADLEGLLLEVSGKAGRGIPRWGAAAVSLGLSLQFHDQRAG